MSSVVIGASKKRASSDTPEDEGSDRKRKKIDEPRVLHRRKTPSGVGVYIGRPTKWGNKFVIGKDGDRNAVIAKYRRWLDNDPQGMRIKQQAKTELRGESLVCWCAPEACHGDVLLEVANQVDHENKSEQ